MLSSIDFSNKGILHTGQMGDGFLGSFLPNKHHEPAKMGVSLKESYTAKKIRPYLEKELSLFENNEMYKVYNRGFNAVFNGYRVIEQFTPFVSPFLNEDFVKASLAIPPQNEIWKENICQMV